MDAAHVPVGTAARASCAVAARRRGAAGGEDVSHRLCWWCRLSRAHARSAPFVQGLRDLGYVEGRNIVIEYRSAEQQARPAPGSCRRTGQPQGGHHRRERVAGRPWPPSNATKTIPIVFADAGDPVEAGLVASLARPGRQRHRVDQHSPRTLAAKRLEFLKEVRSGGLRVAVLWNPPPIQLVAQQVRRERRSRPGH